MEKLSSTLKQLLNSANISEAELARRTGIAQPMVNRLATGKNKNPKLETLKPIAKYFSVTFSQLLGEEELPTVSAIEGSSIITSSSFQLPLHNLSEFKEGKVSSEQVIPTTANVSSEAFALIIDNNSLEPRFSSDTILIIEPQIQYHDNDFIMIKDIATNKVNLMQLKVSETGKSLISLEAEQPTVTLNIEQHKILGVLLQSKHTYK